MYMNSFLTSDNCTNKNQLHSLAFSNNMNNSTASNNFDENLPNRYFRLDSSTSSADNKDNNNTNNNNEKQSTLIELNSFVSDENRLSSSETRYLSADYNAIDSSADLSVNNVVVSTNPTIRVVNNSNINLTNNTQNVNYILNNNNNNNHLLKPSIFFCFFFWIFFL
jgi:hypothetical protein